MDSSVLGSVDSIDPTIFSFIDVGNTTNASGDQVDFNWVDEFITSTETCEPADTEGPSGQNASSAAAVTIQQAAASVQQQQQLPQQQQQLLQNVLQQQQQQQQQQTPSVGQVIMAMGQSSQQQTLAMAASDSSSVAQQMLSNNQTQLLHSNVGGQSMAQPLILKASNQIQLVASSVSQSTAAIGGTPQQFVPAVSGLSSIPVSQRSSPLLNRSLTPNQIPATTSQLPAINLLHVQQPQQLTQTLPLSNLVAANQHNLQGHAVLTAQGSNIVHTQNALIQNPNVVNVNVAHVVPNHQLSQLQVLQTPQGKIYVQSPAGNQGLPQQLCLGQVAGAQPVQMAGQPVQLAGAQTMQVASNVGLAQPAAVIAQPQSNVALGSNTGVGQQQTSYNLINFGGSQGQILVQRMPSATANVTQAQPLPQGPIFLRTVNGQQQLMQQPTLQSTPSTTQRVKRRKYRYILPACNDAQKETPVKLIPQQLVAQTAGTTQSIPLQQLLTGMGGPSLQLVGQAAGGTTPQVSSLSSSTTTTTPSIVFQPLVTANQVPLLGQQVSTQAGSKSGTVTLNLGGQNLNLHPLQNLSTLQLNSSQPQPILVQQQQQQKVTIQQAVVPTPKVSTGSSSKKSKSKTSTTSSTASSSASSSLPAMSTDNILSAALMSSGILDDMGFQNLMNGSDMSDSTLMQTEIPITPSPSSVHTSHTPTPPPPPPTPPTTGTKKSKKKKKEVAAANVLQHVVLSSTPMRSGITITTASATTVTTTLSQSALSAQTLIASTPSFVNTPVVSLKPSSSILSGVTQVTTATLPTQPSLPAVTFLHTSTTPTVSGRGKQGPPNVTVRGVGSVQSMNAEDVLELRNIEASMNKLKEHQDQNSLAIMQQLDMKRRKILAANGNSLALSRQQQEGHQPEQRLGAAGTMQIRLQGQSVTTHIPADSSSLPQPQQTSGTQASIQPKVPQAIVPLQCSSLGTQGQTTLQLTTAQPAVQVDVKPAVGTPSNPVLQIQPKSNSKLTLLSPKAEPAASSCTIQTRVGGDASTDIKPVLGLGGVEIAHTSSGSSQGSTLPAGTGKVIMAMANPPAPGQGATVQPKVLRIQFGGPSGQPTAFPKVSTTPITVTTTHQPILPSPHKQGISSSTVTTATTSATTSPAVSHAAAGSVSTNQARPVKIKIANKVLTVQLTPQQQEKLELHLSRMTLEQQQAFLRQQQHILAKLQHRVDSNTSSQASTPQKPVVAAGSELPPTSSAATTTIAPVSAAAADTAPPVQQAVQVMSAISSLTTTPAQQLPATVQALVGSQPKTESGKQGTGANNTSAAATGSALCRINLDIPKSSMIHSQLSRDQEHATKPDTESPFKDHREACRRLLRYHVHQSEEPIEHFDEFDQNFDAHCEDLIARKDSMFAKYRMLLMKDSTRRYATSEQVQISRMWYSEMTTLQREERDLVANDPDSFVPMPMSYLEKDLSKPEEESSEEEEEESYPASEEEEEEEEEKEEENKQEESEDEVMVLGETPAKEAVFVKEEREAVHALSPEDYFNSSPYQPFVEEGLESPRPEAMEQEEEVWENPHQDQHPAWEESSDKDHVWDVSSEIEPDQLHSSFNDSFEASTPLQEEHDLTHSSPPRETSSPVAEEQCSFQSESPRSRSSPPPPEPPARTMVKLVIRNDGSGFTSKLLEKRRSSDAGERRSLRSRSHSGHERGEVKRVKKESVTEEVEYIDVDNSKYSKGVSVKLERLSERTSQEYGLNIASRAGSSVLAGGAHKTTAADSSGSSVTSSSSGSKSVSKSGRRKRRRDEMTSFSCKKVKKESDFSGVKTGDCDKPSDSVFREVKEERGFYVGSAMESLDHFDSEDDYDGGGHFVGGRVGPSVIDVKREVPTHSASSHCSSTHNSVSSLEEGSGKRLGGQRHRSYDDLMPDTQEDMDDDMFAQPHSASFLHGHRRSENNSRRALETSFDLDCADPQRSMVNPQVQSAIDSILNNSGSVDPYDSGAAATGTVRAPQHSGVEEYETSSMSGIRQGMSSRHWGQGRSRHNDLDTAVRSIHR